MNVPYVKQFDKSGLLLNPIKGNLKTQFPNRTRRRKHIQKERFIGNSKGAHLTVEGKLKYRRRVQLIDILDKITLKTSIKRILHYDLA